MNLEIEKESFTVLLGPSGCGKSTILRMIAGLEEPTEGDIIMGGNSVRDIEPGKRNVAMVFQNYALYPTMTVKENIEFGLKNMKLPKEEREERINNASKSLGIIEFLNRKPQQLSGGQRQRVALARALVKKPDVFLMDEPLSNLDAKLRSQIRVDLIELHQKLKSTFVYVTHDQVEAMSMGTEIVLLERGRIKQQGTPEAIYNLPENMFSAKFIGSPPMNILPLNVLNEGKTSISHIGFRPEKAYIDSDLSELKDVYSFYGKVTAKEMLGDQKIFKVKTEFGNIQVKSFDERKISMGNCVVRVDNRNIHYFDENGNRVAKTLS
ncbi:ABC transporter ATP-binding protein [Anaerosphaera multitolerans]|uniref:ABC transporter ATP-binding protein n=2 Tax=Anaerosphaera multitolerans TaxID=2487351 RepID=A0A437SAS6_9FIRM|nr:ABC transporter ATP-binding protein [Anaerosphaera multitolerans]